MGFRRGIEVVEGAKRGAIYDLEDRRVYWLNRTATAIASLLKEGADRQAIIESLVIRGRIALPEAELQFDQFFYTLQSLGLLTEDNNVRTHPRVIKTDPRLKQVWCEITGRCNLQCLHCYADAGPTRGTDHDLQQSTLLDFVSAIGRIGCNGVQLTGGEPFLRPAVLWSAVQAARDAHISTIEVFSNLTLVKRSDIRLMKEYDLRIATTILGHTSEVHDGITQVNGSFRKTMRNLESILSDGISVRVGVVILRQNEMWREQIREFLVAKGIGELHFDNSRPVGRGQSCGSPASDSDLDTKTLRPPSVYDFHYVRQYNPCWGHHLALMADGSLTPCVFSRGISVGNLKTESIESLIADNRIEEYWALSKDKIHVCRDCELRYACSDCRPLANALGHGNIYAKTSGCSYDPYSDKPGEIRVGG